MKIIFTRAATLDLENIEQYFSCELNSPKMSRKMLTNIFSALDLVASFPLIGQKLSDFFFVRPEFLNCRAWTTGNYKLFYLLENNSLIVIRVFDTRQNYKPFFQ